MCSPACQSIVFLSISLSLFIMARLFLFLLCVNQFSETVLSSDVVRSPLLQDFNSSYQRLSWMEMSVSVSSNLNEVVSSITGSLRLTCPPVCVQLGASVFSFSPLCSPVQWRPLLAPPYTCISAGVCRPPGVPALGLPLFICEPFEFESMSLLLLLFF